MEHVNRIIEVNALHFSYFWSLYGCNFIFHFSYAISLSIFVFHSYCFVLFCFVWISLNKNNNRQQTTTKTHTADKTTEERAHCFKHLSKSASELDSHENYTNLTQPSPTPQRRTVAGVLQRTHGFLSTLKVIIAII